MSGMVKVIPPDSWQFNEPSNVLIKIAKAGLRGNDLKALIKRAGFSFADELKHIALKPGDVPVHNIALGSEEFFGPNRNSDGFKEADCRVDHPTFVKYARRYRNHDNKNPERSYGHIKLSHYNEDMHRIELLTIFNGTKEAAERNGGLIADEEMKLLESGKDIPTSMACGLFGTLVKVQCGFKLIEEITTDDEVLTHRGRYRRVVSTAVRRKQQYAVISTECFGRQELKFTPDHLFYVGRWCDIPKSTRRYNGLKSDHRTGFSNHFRRRYRDILYAHARWLPCGELRPGDLLFMPIDRGDGSSNLTSKEARLLGYYIAEGNIDGHSNSNNVCYTVNKKDDFVKEINQLVSEGVNIRFNNHSGSEEAYSVRVYSSALATICEQEVGRRVENKVIPRRIIDASADIKLDFISTWFNGDGWQDIKGLHWSTCSRTLSLELQNLLASIGIPASVYRIDHTSDLPNGVKREIPGIEYTVNVSNRYSAAFAGHSKAKVTQTKDHVTVFITGDYLAIPIKSVRIIEDAVDVCDLSVDEDESFTAFSLAVHNCKVAYDVCAGCGNKARTRKEYCTGIEQGGHCKRGGCRDNLGVVHNDGFITHVHNPNAHHFDMSKVFRGADRTSFDLGIYKSASGIVIGGAELAEKMGLDMPPQLVGEQVLWPTRLEKLAQQLAQYEREMDSGEKRASYDWAFSRELDTENLQWTYSGDRRTTLAALSLTKIAVPLEGFVELMGLEKTAELVDTARRYLPGIYGRMLSAGQIVDTNLKPYTAAGRVGNELLKWASERMVNYSFDRRCFEGRLKLASLYNVSTPAPIQPLLLKVAGGAETLARNYALYKLAFLQSLIGRDEDFDLIARMVVRQNYLS